MPARLDALDHERVGARPRAAATASPAVVTVTQVAQPAACRRSSTAAPGQPKVNDTSGTALGRAQRQLVLPAVVVVARLAKGDATALGVALEPLRVAGDLARVAGSGRAARTG